MKRLKSFITVVIVLLSIITTFLVIIMNSFEKYSLMFLLPISFFFCYCLVLKKFVFEKFSFFRVTFVIVLFLRYVIFPDLIVLSDYDRIVSQYVPTISQTNIAILLMCYELIAYSFFIKVYTLSKKKYNLKNNFEYNSTNQVFNIFIIFSLFLLVLTPSVLNYFNFITVNESIGLIDYSNIIEITILCVVCAKGLLFLKILSSLAKKYKQYNNNFYYYLAILITILNSCIYYGANRSTFIFLTVSSFAAFFTFFKKGLKKILIAISIIVIIILPIITNYRNYYDYYSEFSGVRKELISKQGLINEYFGGINNVAIGIETSNLFPDKRNLINLIYDFTRPVIGLNVIMKKFNMDYSNLYFNRTYHQSDLVSVIFPTISQGYFYFGFFGAPILGIILIFIAFQLEKCCDKFSNPFFVYFFTPSLFRLGTLTGANLNIQMNDLSLKVIIPLLLLLLVTMLKTKKTRFSYNHGGIENV